MTAFFETLSLAIVFMLIVNVLSKVFVDTKIYKTYMVAIAVIIIYILICPLARIDEISGDFKESSVESPYYGEGEDYEFFSDVYENY